MSAVTRLELCCPNRWHCLICILHCNAISSDPWHSSTFTPWKTWKTMCRLKVGTRHHLLLTKNSNVMLYIHMLLSFLITISFLFFLSRVSMTVEFNDIPLWSYERIKNNKNVMLFLDYNIFSLYLFILKKIKRKKNRNNYFN